MPHEGLPAGRSAFVALLVERGLVNNNELHLAEVHAEREGVDVPEAMVRIGLISEEDCCSLLSAATGLPQVDVATVPRSELALRLVPEPLARRREAVPLGVDNRTLTYATHRPFDTEIERDLSSASGRWAMPVIARRSALLEALDQCYPQRRDRDRRASTGHGRRSARIIVADDDGITRMLVKTLLERAQFEVLEAAHGRQAIELASTGCPDLMLMDLNMPEMDGYEAIQCLRRQPAFTSIPIIVLTAEDGPSIERRVLDIGADDYMLKPFEPAILLSRVNAVFRRLEVAAA